MGAEPAIKRAVAFVDGQNLYHRVKVVFGHTYPNYDARALAEAVCRERGFALEQTRFYTGVPEQHEDPRWYAFWMNKLAAMRRDGVVTFHRFLSYTNEEITLPDGSVTNRRVGREKGIDVRIALDVIRLAHRCAYDVALLFTQDQDLSEVAREVGAIAAEQSRWMRVASAYPASTTSANNRGVDRTDWIALDRSTYDACIDPADYRPRAARGGPSRR